MPFQTMDCDFYEDGLASETKVFESPDADECYRALMDGMISGQVFLGRVVEVDDRGEKVYEEIPYPRVREPEWPQFYLDFMRSGQ